MVISNTSVILFTLLVIGSSIGAGRAYQKKVDLIEIQALHTQIKKQNCEENTIPRLRKELLGK